MTREKRISQKPKIRRGNRILIVFHSFNFELLGFFGCVGTRYSLRSLCLHNLIDQLPVEPVEGGYKGLPL